MVVNEQFVPLDFQSMKHRKWWTNRPPELFVIQEVMPNLSVGYYCEKVFKRDLNPSPSACQATMLAIELCLLSNSVLGRTGKHGSVCMHAPQPT